MSTVSVTIRTPKDTSKLRVPVKVSVSTIINLLAGLIQGSLQGAISIQTSGEDPVAASATATLATVVAGNTITIGGTTLTAAAAPANQSEFLSVGTDTVVAAALAACINAHTTLSKIAQATSSAAVVTISCAVTGPIGNQVAVTRVGAPITLSGAVLSGGLGGPQGPTALIGR